MKTYKFNSCFLYITKHKFRIEMFAMLTDANG